MTVKKRFPYRAAFVACNGGCRQNKENPCSFGCTGCGSCMQVCKFGAVALNEYGTAQVDEEKCMACGLCVKSCPQHIIRIHECANYIAVKCSNHDKGADARKKCEVSCIGCGLCEKNCTAGAIAVHDNCAVIEEDICLSCGLCAVNCPHHAIYDLRGIFTEAR